MESCKINMVCIRLFVESRIRIHVLRDDEAVLKINITSDIVLYKAAGGIER